MPDGPAERSGGDGLEARVAVLEQIARSTLAALERLDRRFDRNDSRFDAIDRASSLSSAAWTRAFVNCARFTTAISA